MSASSRKSSEGKGSGGSGISKEASDGSVAFINSKVSVLESVATGAPLPEILAKIVCMVEEQSTGMCCSILLLDAAEGCLRHGAGPHLPEEYMKAIDGRRIGPKAGSCGTAAHRKERVIVADIATHPYWARYRRFALAHGLRACWSTPIFSPAKDVLGTFAMYYRNLKTPTPEEIQWVDVAVHLAAIAISRDRANAELVEREERFSLAARAASDAIWDWDLQTNKLWWGASFYSMFGYTPEEIEPGIESWSNRIHPDDLGRVERGIYKAIQFGGKRWMDEYRFLCKDGHYTSVEDRGFILHDAQGRPVRMVGGITDITRRTQLQEERQRLIKTLGERVQELDLLHRVARLLQTGNEVNRQLFDSLVNMLPSGWRFPEVCEARIVWEGAESRTKGWRETRWKLSNPLRGGGKSGCIEIAYTEAKTPPGEDPFLTEERTLLGSLAEMIEARLAHHQALSALAEREEEFRVTFENAAIGMGLTTADGRLVKVNPAFCRILGYSERALVGMSFEDYTHPEDLKAHLAAHESMIRGETNSYQLEKRCARKDGSIVWGRLTASAVREPDGRPRFVIGMFEDITAQKQAETDRERLGAQLRQAQRMQSLGTFASGISHDFKNILTAISGNAEVCEMELPSNHSARAYLDQIRKATDRATNLVRRILAFSRQQDTRRKPMELQALANEVVALVRPSLSRNIRLHLDTQIGLPWISADATQVHQVLMNLASNAVHAMGELGGDLKIKLESVTVADAEARLCPDLSEGPYVRVSVSDNGCGMDKQTMERIFDPFFTTKAPGQGTGLGLSVVHGIMKEHDGAILVNSEVNHGTTFQIYFPALEAGVGGSPEEEKIKPGHGEHILFVDDEETLVYLMSRILKRLSYRVTGFHDPAHALQAFRLRPHDFDAIIADIGMPGYSGTEFAREVLNVRRDLPIILTSGYVRAEDVEITRELGIDSPIIKPNSAAEMAEVIHRALEQHPHATRPDPTPSKTELPHPAH